MNKQCGFGLYDPANEHDACGVGFVANVKGEATRRVVEMGIENPLFDGLINAALERQKSQRLFDES